MERGELVRIITREGLAKPVLPGQPRRPDAVALEVEGDSWTVSVLSERAWPLASTVCSFDNESDALEHLLLKLRQGKAADEAMARLRWSRRG